MFSVLIQNQKTIEIFQEFHPIFTEAMNQGKIGVCRWMEPGTTVDTALPELKELIEDKEEWRAIIVRILDEDAMSMYETVPLNPYDFKYYHEEKRKYGESPIPLVRLTNMLGELPAPEIRYETVTIMEENKSPKIIYEPRKNEEEELIYQELLDQYDYDGKRPSEIILVSLRMPKRRKKESIEKVWTDFKEVDSSSFWKKNCYANSCRFIVYDLKQEGSVQYEADMFKFWLSVLILGLNRIDSDELQAYRLYRMNVQLDKEILQEEIQNCINRLYGAKYFMKQILQAEDSEWTKVHRDLPDYKMEVPVMLDLPRRNDMSVDDSLFPLVAGNVEDDLRRWGESKKNAEYKLRETAGQAEIALDEAAERMRGMGSVEESEVKQINKYQKKKMDADLENLYFMVISTQKELPDSQNTINKNVKEKAEEVRTGLLSRITAEQILGIVMIILLAITLSVIPCFLVYTDHYSGSVKSMITFMLLLIDIMLVPIFFMVFLQKRELVFKVRDYNHELHASMMKIVENSEVYSTFLSSIVSHSRGMSYLQILKNKKFTMSSTRIAVDTHLKAIDHMMYSLEKWNKAFYLNVNFNQSFYDDDIFDISILPIKNKLYTFEYGKQYQIPLNNSGRNVDVNFEFVTKLELIREELYD